MTESAVKRPDILRAKLLRSTAILETAYANGTWRRDSSFHVELRELYALNAEAIRLVDEVWPSPVEGSSSPAKTNTEIITSIVDGARNALPKEAPVGHFAVQLPAMVLRHPNLRYGVVQQLFEKTAEWEKLPDDVTLVIVAFPTKDEVCWFCHDDTSPIAGDDRSWVRGGSGSRRVAHVPCCDSATPQQRIQFFHDDMDYDSPVMAVPEQDFVLPTPPPETRPVRMTVFEPGSSDPLPSSDPVYAATLGYKVESTKDILRRQEELRASHAIR